MGYGMKRGLTGLGRLVLGGMYPEEELGPFSAAAREEDKRLYESGGLASQPSAGPGRSLGEAVSVPSAPGGSTVAAKAPSLFSRLLGQRAGVRAAEGAVGAAQFADQGQEAEAAGMGSALSMTLGRFGDAGKRLGSGLVKKSDDAQQLELMLRAAGEEAHLPISLSYDRTDFPSRAVGSTYKNASPFFPFAGDVLEAQRKEALDAVRLAAYRDAAPANFQVTPDDLKNPDLLRKKLTDEFNRLYDTTVKSYAFNVPSTYLQDMETLIKKADPKINKTSLQNVLGQVDELMAQFSDGSGVIQGQNLLYYKRAVGSLLRQAPPHEKAALRAAVDWVDQHIADELKVGNVPQNLADLKTYEDLHPAWRSFRAVVDATDSARDGGFSPEQLARKAKPLTPEKELARTADRVLGSSASRFTPAGRAMAGAATMGAGIGLAMGPLAATTASLGGLGAVSKPTQRLLTGDTWLQERLKKMAEDLEKQGIRPGSVLSLTRRGAAAETGDE